MKNSVNQINNTLSISPDGGSSGNIWIIVLIIALLLIGFFLYKRSKKTFSFEEKTINFLDNDYIKQYFSNVKTDSNNLPVILRVDKDNPYNVDVDKSNGFSYFLLTVYSSSTKVIDNDKTMLIKTRDVAEEIRQELADKEMLVIK